jgi:hypothetical protein
MGTLIFLFALTLMVANVLVTMRREARAQA